MTAPTTAAHPFTQGNPIANGTNAGANTSAAGSTISANDFLTLLVTEMKNQDPTAQTDPNQYVNQLVQVNSLQQLIEINQNLSSALDDSSSVARAVRSAQPAIAGQPRAVLDRTSDVAAATGTTETARTSSPIAVSTNPIRGTAGNLGVPGTNPAAQRVAQALSGFR